MVPTKSILLVEDDHLDVALTLEAFRSNGIPNEVIVAHDGAKALEILAQLNSQSGSLAVILLDLKMPGMGGLGFLRAIKEMADMRQVPIVVLTSSREESDVRDAYELGANAYVVKPASGEEYAKVIGSLAHFWTVLNEPPLP